MLDDGEGTRYIYIFRKDGDNYRLDCKSAPLPPVDGQPAIIGDNGTDYLQLIYGEGEFYYLFHPLGPGIWRLRDAWARDNVSFDPTFGLVLWNYADAHLRCLPGKTPEYDLASLDPAVLPQTFGEAIAGTDTTGWAIVKSGAPTDRLHLRARPSKSANSLGRYYSGTPVRVRSISGDWAEVDILGIEGYMMAEFLAFDLEMLEVNRWFPSLWVPRDAYGKDVRFYQQPETRDSLYAGDLTDDQSAVYILADAGDGWFHAVCGGGLAGHVQSRHFEPTDHPPMGF